MKKSIFFVFAALISCKNSVEENCFMSGKENAFETYAEEKPYTAEQILKEKPDYLLIEKLSKYRSFKKDSIESHTFNYSDEDESKRKYDEYKAKYKDFDDQFFGQFNFIDRQNNSGISYALGTNNLGFWLLEISQNQPKAYFLGLSFSHYYINKIQQNPLIKDGFLQFEGSLVNVIKVPGLPGYDDYSAMQDGKLFKIRLSDLEKDSDKDGYNDIFENCFGLNPANADSDGDKINDFDDLNPLFKSEKNKFTSLYEELMSQHFAFNENNLKKMHYFFIPYENDCEYFQKMNPKYRILILPEKESKKSNYLKVTNVVHDRISKIRKDKKNLNKFYIYESGGGSSSDFTVEFKNGKWVFTMVSQTVS